MPVFNSSNYSIHIDTPWEFLNKFLSEKKYSKIVVLVDDNTMNHCYPIFKKNFNHNHIAFQIPAGEVHKTIQTCERIWQFLFKEKLDRNSILINLGGGVIGDMGGFCASTFKRGIDFIQMPTTLLSQVDASIGGKLGIDFNYIKNGIGVFNDPQAVVINSDFLKTLPKKEIRSGFAEMIKHGLIQDSNHWAKLSAVSNLDEKSLRPFIMDSIKIKDQIVAADPFEKNIRKLLNFGHTIGHAIESVALKNESGLAHGEAVAIGMICEAYLSNIHCQLSKEELSQIVQFINKVYPHFSIKGIEEEVMKNMLLDKKNEGKNINFSLLNSIGSGVINQYSEDHLIRASLEFYSNLGANQR